MKTDRARSYKKNIEFLRKQSLIKSKRLAAKIRAKRRGNKCPTN